MKSGQTPVEQALFAFCVFFIGVVGGMGHTLPLVLGLVALIVNLVCCIGIAHCESKLKEIDAGEREQK